MFFVKEDLTKFEENNSLAEKLENLSDIGLTLDSYNGAFTNDNSEARESQQLYEKCTNTTPEERGIKRKNDELNEY